MVVSKSEISTSRNSLIHVLVKLDILKYTIIDAGSLGNSVKKNLNSTEKWVILERITGNSPKP